MSKITGNEPANSFGFTTADGSSHVCEYGLTIRQEFAKAAMQGILSNEKIVDILRHVPQGERYASIAETACLATDALIKELNKNQTT